MKRIKVDLSFDGSVTVDVPDHLSDDDAKILASKLALARVLATTDNPDAPEDAACCDYAAECSDQAEKTAEDDWDMCDAFDLGGVWRLT